MKKITTTCLLSCFCLSLLAQKKLNFKFEKIGIEDLQKKIYSIDSNANAIVLGDVGSTEIIGNSKGWFSFLFKRHLRIHILNKNGYDKAKLEIPLYHNLHSEEKIEALKATTYNLDNGSIAETRLDKENVFTEKASKLKDIKKFTLPAVKEGSIIDVEYRILSDYIYTLQPWRFQDDIPELWSEYTLSIPQFLDYAFISKGYIPFVVNEKKERPDRFNIMQSGGAEASERFSFNANVADYRWAAKDVPALKEENYISSLENYISHIEFQLSAYREPLQYKNLIDTWQHTTKELMQDEDFGKKLDRSNPWLSDVMKPFMNINSTEQKAKQIFAYVRDNITCTNPYALYLSQPLKTILKTRAGSVSEVNLLLTAMLKYADIDANPIMLSTKSNGLVYTSFPMLSRFNYIITSAQIDGKTYLLDASRPHLGFGRLTTECYNGHARMINEEATPLALMSDSLHENKITSVLLINNDKGEWEGTMQQVPGYYESVAIRNKVQAKGQDQFFKEIIKAFNSEIKIVHPKIDSLTQYDYPVNIFYDFKLEQNKEDIVYVNPLFGEGYHENPFKSTERAYPVEMPFVKDETYSLTMYVPQGYVVDELPKPMKVKYNEEGDGMFEYLISQSADIISLRSRVKFNKANFMPEEYDILREFFNIIVNKQKEQIVFKKKK